MAISIFFRVWVFGEILVMTGGGQFGNNFYQENHTSSACVCVCVRVDLKLFVYKPGVFKNMHVTRFLLPPLWAFAPPPRKRLQPVDAHLKRNGRKWNKTFTWRQPGSVMTATLGKKLLKCLLTPFDAVTHKLWHTNFAISWLIYGPNSRENLLEVNLFADF